MARASGCAARIEAETVPLDIGPVRDIGVLAKLLTGGDDYEVLAAVPARRECRFKAAAAQAGVPVTRIGALTAGPGDTLVRFEGRALPLGERSYQHRQSG